MFINRCNRPYKTDNIDQKFRYLRKCISEIYPEDDFSGITPHCLRHTFATNGINSGISVINIQSLLGHADTRTLLDTYMHIGYDDKKASIDKIEESTTPTYVSIEESDEKNLQHKWSNVKRYKGKENYKMN